MASTPNSTVQLLRNTVATLAYRASKVLRDAPSEFEHFRAGENTRTAGAIVAHMGDLMEWASRAIVGDTRWHESPPAAWNVEVSRFFSALKTVDNRLDSDVPPLVSPERLFQGPIADALTHVGQLATLRRLAGSGIRGENYFVAEISSGRVGIDQPPPVREFD